MYLRLPKNEITTRYERFMSLGEDYIGQYFGTEHVRGLIVTGNNIARTQKALRYIISDPQLQRHRVYTDNVDIAADHGYKISSIDFLKKELGHRMHPSSDYKDAEEFLFISLEYDAEIIKTLMEIDKPPRIYVIMFDCDNEHPEQLLMPELRLNSDAGFLRCAGRNIQQVY